MANLQRYTDPFGNAVDELFRGFFVKPLGFEPSASAATDTVRRVRIDVTEQNGEYKVYAELPGVKKEDIRVEVDGDQVTLSAETRLEREADKGERVLHSERYFGKVARSFRLGAELDESRAVAKFNDGVLELTLPKKVVAAAKQITIQ